MILAESPMPRNDRPWPGWPGWPGSIDGMARQKEWGKQCGNTYFFVSCDQAPQVSAYLHIYMFFLPTPRFLSLYQPSYCWPGLGPLVLSSLISIASNLCFSRHMCISSPCFPCSLSTYTWYIAAGLHLSTLWVPTTQRHCRPVLVSVPPRDSNRLLALAIAIALALAADPCGVSLTSECLMKHRRAASHLVPAF